MAAVGGWVSLFIVLAARSVDLSWHRCPAAAVIAQAARPANCQSAIVKSEAPKRPAPPSQLLSVPSVPPPPPKPIRTFKFKGELAFVLQEERLKIGVEVGVFRGGFSGWMLSHWKACERYYMVDLWAPQQHYRQMDAAGLGENLQRMEAARANVARFGAKAVLLRKSSVQAAATFEDGSLDFVYLDARHTYDAVMEDMEAWWPKLRRGGILAGEDYMDADEVWVRLGHHV